MWLYLRMICFPVIIYELLQAEYPAERAQFQPYTYLTAIFLSMLACMHYLWFYMFQRLNLAYYRNYSRDNLDEVMHIWGITPPSNTSSDSDRKKSN